MSVKKPKRTTHLQETAEKKNLMRAEGLREFVALIRGMDGESVEHFLKVCDAIQSGKIQHDRENSCLIFRDTETMQEILGDDHQDTWSLE